MSSKNSNKINVPEARAAMDKFKMEAASEVGVNLKEGYNGHLTSREAGSVGGQMVKKMIESYEKNMYLLSRTGHSATAERPVPLFTRIFPFFSRLIESRPGFFLFMKQKNSFFP